MTILDQVRLGKFTLDPDVAAEFFAECRYATRHFRRCRTTPTGVRPYFDASHRGLDVEMFKKPWDDDPMDIDKRLAVPRKTKPTAAIAMKERQWLTYKQRRITAYHESGHAVVAMALGVPVVKIEIFETVQDDDTLGMTYCDDIEICPEVELLYALAGPACEYMAAGEHLTFLKLFRHHNCFGKRPKCGNCDYECFERLYLEMSGVSEEVYRTRTGETQGKRYIKAKTAVIEEKYLKPNWNTVRRLACRLMETGVIYDYELKMIGKSRCLAETAA